MTEDHITYNSQIVEKSDIQPLGRIFISLIIVSYFSLVLIQAWPEGPFRDSAKAYADRVILLFGLKQRWNLFAPNIRLLNQFATCQITFRDGSIKLYEWPENRKFSFDEKIERVQMRKFVVDAVNEPFYKSYWPFVAQYMAQCNWDPDNPPVLVEPVFNGINVPGFNEFTRQDRQNLTTVNHRTINLPFQVRNRDQVNGGRQ